MKTRLFGILAGISLFLPAAGVGAATNGVMQPVPPVVPDRFQLLTNGAVRLSGVVDDRIRLQPKVWFDEKTLAAMADIYRRRPNGFADGEFWGKAVRALCHHYAYSHDPHLRELLDTTLADLMSTQSDDGCLSGYQPAKQPYNSDLWDRKYVLLGLLNGYEATGDPKTLQSAVRAADQLLTQVGPPPKVRVVDTHYITRAPQPEGGWGGMESTSILEPMVRLYRATGRREYLDFARYMIEVEGGSLRGSIFEAARAGRDVREFGGDGDSRHNVAHAYNIISCFEGLTEYYRATGDARWLQAVTNVYANVLAKETTIIGAQSGFGPNDGLAPTEQFSHTGLHQTAPVRDGLEGCTHARWMALSRHLLLLEGNPKYADQFERTLYNALLGSVRPDGAKIDYHTNLNGVRPAKVNYRKTFVGREITCCVFNVNDTLALIPTVAVMTDGQGPVVNLFLPGTAQVPLADGNRVELEFVTDYPRTGEVKIKVNPDRAARFPLQVRIPAWSKTTVVTVNGETQSATPGTYLAIERTWSPGDTIALTLDMRCHLVSPPAGTPAGAANFRALVRGPVVLARDKRLGGDIHEEVEIAADTNGVVALVPRDVTVPAWMQFSVPTVGGGSFEVIDFNSSGNTWDAQSERVTWIARPGAPSPRWIWFPDAGNPAVQAPVGKRWFRRVIELPPGREVRRATALFCADNQFTLFVNGQRIGGGDSWQNPVSLDIGPALRTGRAVLAVEAVNTEYRGPNAAGLIGRIDIEFAEGAPLTVFTDGSWRCADAEMSGWQAASLDDAAWPAARVLGGVGMKPWTGLTAFAP